MYNIDIQVDDKFLHIKEMKTLDKAFDTIANHVRYSVGGTVTWGNGTTTKLISHKDYVEAKKIKITITNEIQKSK